MASLNRKKVQNLLGSTFSQIKCTYSMQNVPLYLKNYASSRNIFMRTFYSFAISPVSVARNVTRARVV